MKKKMSFLRELPKWMEWNPLSTLSFWRIQICYLCYQDSWKGLGSTSCHQTYRSSRMFNSLSCTMEEVSLWRLILLASAQSAILSSSLMAPSHSGEFPLFWLLPISIWACSNIGQLKKQARDHYPPPCLALTLCDHELLEWFELIGSTTLPPL